MAGLKTIRKRLSLIREETTDEEARRSLDDSNDLKPKKRRSSLLQRVKTAVRRRSSKNNDITALVKAELKKEGNIEHTQSLDDFSDSSSDKNEETSAVSSMDRRQVFARSRASIAEQRSALQLSFKDSFREKISSQSAAKLSSRELSHNIYNSFMRRASSSQSHFRDTSFLRSVSSTPYDLSQVISHCLYHSFLIYCVAEIRSRQRRGEVSLKLETPLVSHEIDAQALDEFPRLQYETQQALVYVPEPSSKIVAIEDDYEDECVYYIDVDKRNKFINLVFRGSFSDYDWKVNTRMSMEKVPDPTEKDSVMGVYKGMHDHLFGEGSSRVAKNKYCQILRQLRALLRVNDGFQVRLTGHSMGGALASIFALYATSQNVWVPSLQIISFGAPRWGDAASFRAFRRLEHAKRISLLRVVNHEDIVPTLPDLSVAPQAATPFYHVGIELRLFTNLWERSEDASIPKRCFHFKRFPNCAWTVLFRDMCKIFHRWLAFWWLVWQGLRGYNILEEFPGMHHCMEYMVRIERECEDLCKYELWKLHADFLEGKHE